MYWYKIEYHHGNEHRILYGSTELSPGEMSKSESLPEMIELSNCCYYSSKAKKYVLNSQWENTNSNTIFLRATYIIRFDPLTDSPTLGFPKGDRFDPSQGKAEDVTPLVKMDTLSIELGHNFLPLLNNEDEKKSFFEQLTMTRRQIAVEIGLSLPPIRVRDNAQLNRDSYTINLLGSVVADAEIKPNMMMLMPPQEDVDLERYPFTEPAYGLKVNWKKQEDILPEDLEKHSIVSPFTVLISHLVMVVRSDPSPFLSREAVITTIDSFEEENFRVISELYRGSINYSELHSVFSYLLTRKCKINNVSLVLEKISDFKRAESELRIEEFVYGQVKDNITFEIPTTYE